MMGGGLLLASGSSSEEEFCGKENTSVSKKKRKRKGKNQKKTIFNKYGVKKGKLARRETDNKQNKLVPSNNKQSQN
jgi:hypothetical protein